MVATIHQPTSKSLNTAEQQFPLWPTVVFCPVRTGNGLAEAAGFAQELVQGTGEWEAGCHRTLAAIPLNVDLVIYDCPARGDDDRG